MTAEIFKPFGAYATPGVCDDVVGVLKGLLARAERGEIVGVAYGAVDPMGAMIYGYKVGSTSGAVLLAAAVLSYQLLAAALVDVSPDTPTPSAS